MARNQAVVACPAGVWTQLTNDDVTDIAFQVLAGVVEIRGTVGATPPGATDRGRVYRNDGFEYQEGELRIDIKDFADAAGINRVYARPVNGRRAKVLVDHA